MGLNLRAVGESPATADAAGIDTTKYKYFATVIGGGICGIGGMYMSMVTTSGVWVHGCVSGYGWLAVALVIFATWSPLRGMLVALVFGGLTIMRMYVNIPVSYTHLIINKYNVPEDAECDTALRELVDAGCNIIFATSFGFEDYVKEVAAEYPEVQFCHATGYQASDAGLDNMHNYFASIYEARYLAGIAAGMKTESNKLG